MAAESPNFGRDTDRQSDLAVMDANEYKQKRRLERIMDLVDGIVDERNEAWRRYVSGDIDYHGKNVAIQQAVKNAVLTCRTLLVKYYRSIQDENGEEPKDDQYWAGDPKNPLGEIEQEREDDIVIQGLAHFLQTDEIWTVEWEEQTTYRNGSPETETEQMTYSVPEEVSLAAAGLLAEFLSEEQGMELATETMEVDVHAEPW